MPPLTGAQFEELAAALAGADGAAAGAFDKDTLEQLVQFKLGRRLFDFVAEDKPLKTIVFQLIRTAEMEGWTAALIQAVSITRPGHAQVQQFVAAHFPQAAAPLLPAEQVERVKRGLAALATIVERLRDPEIRLIVGRFRADFEITREKVAALAGYKALHDMLHQVEMRYLSSMADAAQLWRQSEAQVQALDRYAGQLLGDCERARQDARVLRNFRQEEDWIDMLVQAARLVQQAVSGGEEAPLASGLNLLRGVLVHNPPRINHVLCEAAGDLRLKQLIEAMQQIEAQLGRTQPAAAPDDEFAAGLQELQLLQPRLGGLVAEHFEWQWLDREIALAATQPGVTPQARFFRWPDFQRRLLALCGLSPQKEWSQQLCANLTALTEAGSAGDSIQFARRFNKFRTEASVRFFNVDAELRDLSSQLAQVAQPLDQLLRIVTHGNG
ncbi:MAG TPA: effector-associated domain EAD1-containing protein [Pirellulaceae bacterium]|nr:effector-associated domain EAD1-containing protein [Pirellulaceae bacterium]